MLIYGINAVTEALRAGRVNALRVSKRSDERMRALLALAQERRVPVRRVDQEDLDRLAPGAVHQGGATSRRRTNTTSRIWCARHRRRRCWWCSTASKIPITSERFSAPPTPQ